MKNNRRHFERKIAALLLCAVLLCVSVALIACSEKCTVTFDTDGGSSVAAQTVNKGEKAARPQDPTKTDADYYYTFDNWYVDANFGTVYDFDTPVTADLTLYAKFTAVSKDANSYEVKFLSDGVSHKTDRVEEGQFATKPADPVKTDFGFMGWYTAETDGAPYDFSAAVNADLTLYARWWDASNLVFTKNADGETAALAEGADLTKLSGAIYLPQKVTADGAVCTLTEIGASALCDEAGTCLISSVAIPSTVTKIGDYAFYGLKNLEELTIPDSVTELGLYPIYTSGVKVLTVGKGVTSLGEMAFAQTALEQVTVTGDLEIGKQAFAQCTALKQANFEGTVSALGDGAFYKCDALEEVTFADITFTNVSDQAFEDCTSLKSVTFNGTIDAVGYHSFSRCLELVVDEDCFEKVTTVGNNAFAQCKKITALNLPNLKTIEYAGFLETGLKNVDLPAVESIGGQAFLHCEELTSVKLPKTLKEIQMKAFSACPKLTSVVFDEDCNLDTIGNKAFCDSGIAEITLPKATTVGKELFTRSSAPAYVDPHEVVVTVLYAEGALPEGWDADWAKVKTNRPVETQNTIKIIYATAA